MNCGNIATGPGALLQFTNRVERGRSFGVRPPRSQLVVVLLRGIQLLDLRILGETRVGTAHHLDPILRNQKRHGGQRPIAHPVAAGEPDALHAFADRRRGDLFGVNARNRVAGMGRQRGRVLHLLERQLGVPSFQILLVLGIVLEPPIPQRRHEEDPAALLQIGIEQRQQLRLVRRSLVPIYALVGGFSFGRQVENHQAVVPLDEIPIEPSLVEKEVVDLESMLMQSLEVIEIAISHRPGIHAVDDQDGRLLCVVGGSLAATAVTPAAKHSRVRPMRDMMGCSGLR